MKVLVSAYACEPERGSEPGCGWMWSRAAARNHDVWVLTRANNRPRIEPALAAASVPRLHVVYIDAPQWLRFWKRGSVGTRVYYVLWQLAAARTARRLDRAYGFDVVHHVTFANMWLPALACVVRAPFVLGPIAGGQRVPRVLYPALGIRGIATELLLSALRTLSRVNPLVRIGWSRAAVILANNEETVRALPPRHRRKALVRSNAVVEHSPVPRPSTNANGHHVALYAGRLNRFKGVSIAIEAVRTMPAWRLVIAGDGPDRARLERLAQRGDLNGRVTFSGWLTRERLWREVAGARAVVVPSLKEGASFVAAEAQSLGVPVVAFDCGGPAALAQVSAARFELVQPGRPAVAAQGFAEALERIAGEPALAVEADFGLDSLASELALIYERAVGRA